AVGPQRARRARDPALPVAGVLLDLRQGRLVRPVLAHLRSLELRGSVRPLVPVLAAVAARARGALPAALRAGGDLAPVPAARSHHARQLSVDHRAVALLRLGQRSRDRLPRLGRTLAAGAPRARPAERDRAHALLAHLLPVPRRRPRLALVPLAPGQRP